MVCFLLALGSFLLLQVSVLIYPGEYKFFSNTISTLSAIKVNGEPNYFSAVTLPLSHLMLASSIFALSIRVKWVFKDYIEQFPSQIRLINLFGLIGASSITIAAITPHGLPEPIGVIHRTFGIFMFPSFMVFASLIVMVNCKIKGLYSPLTMVPLVLAVIFLVSATSVYVIHKTDLINGFGLIPTIQKIGYYLFIIGIIVMVWLQYQDVKKTNKK